MHVYTSKRSPNETPLGRERENRLHLITERYDQGVPSRWNPDWSNEVNHLFQ